MAYEVASFDLDSEEERQERQIGICQKFIKFHCRGLPGRHWLFDLKDLLAILQARQILYFKYWVLIIRDASGIKKIKLFCSVCFIFSSDEYKKIYVIYIFSFPKIWCENREEIHKKNLFERNFVEETL